MKDKDEDKLATLIKSRQGVYRVASKRKGSTITDEDLADIVERARAEYEIGQQLVSVISEEERELCYRFYEGFLRLDDHTLPPGDELQGLFLEGKMVIAPCHLAFMADMRRARAIFLPEED